MWKNKTRYFFTLLLKNAQFKWSTWKQGKEIARAYSRPKQVRLPRIGKRIAAVCLAALVLFALVYVAAPYAVKSYAFAAAAIRNVKHTLAAKKTAVMAEHARKTGAEKQAPALATPRAPAPAPEAKTAPPPKDSAVPLAALPAPAKSFAAGAMDYCIVANKADRTLYLLNTNGRQGTWKSIETFSILVGRNEGQKMSEGDKRTPEGTYFIIGRKESEELNAIYGPVAYVLNYPNEEDRKAGRTGQGIWIHGTREDTTREATRGCVVLDNDDVITLARYLQLGIGTPVLIVNTPGLTQPHLLPNTAQLSGLRERIVAEYAARQGEFQSIVEQWKQAWESRNIETYARFYDAERFSGEGMHWDAWRDKKERIFKTYNKISVGVDKMCVSEFSETTSVVLFMQRYESETMHLQRPKKLSFIKSDGQWKIYKEETFSRQELLL